MNKFIIIAAAIGLQFATIDQIRADDGVLVEQLVVKVIDSVDVPAIEMGLIQSLTVREGDRVTSGQVIGKLDDRQAQLQSDLAQAELAIAKRQSENYYGIDLAERELAQQQQLAEQHKLLRDIAYRKAENDFQIRASEKGEGVAKNEYLRASKARSRFPDSVSQSELDALKLTFEKTQLETKQATFNQGIDLLTAKSEDKASGLHALKIDSARISLKQAKSDKTVISLQADATQHAASLASLMIDRHKIISSLDGVVVQRYSTNGAWVKAGDPIVRVIRLNRLRAEGFVTQAVAATISESEQVTLLADVGDKEIRRPVDFVFVSPEVNPVDSKVKLIVEFDNQDEDILPGTRIALTMDVK